MKKTLTTLLLLCISQHVLAEIEINPGLSGSWIIPETTGQALMIDVITPQNLVFVGWFTFAPVSSGQGGFVDHRWFTAQGSYDGHVAELDLVQTSGGLFNQNLSVENQIIGRATISFEDCSHATLNYSFDDENLSSTVPLQRFSNDVFCQSIVDSQTPQQTEFNLPPEIQLTDVSVNNGRVHIEYRLSDAENDVMDIQAYAIHENGQRYQIPLNNLRRDVGYPVIAGDDKSLYWLYLEDTGFQQQQWSDIRIELIADDGFVDNMQEIVDLVSEQRLINDINTMQGVRHHQGNSIQLESTRNYIRQQMQGRQLPVENQSFIYQGSTGVNIIATLDGNDDNAQMYLIDGHYDTVTTTPGADDNASGTAGMLEAMRVLSQFNSKHSIRFIGFDKEELGLRGSRFYASQLPSNHNIAGMINFEMIGYTCRGQAECADFPNADTSIYNIKSSFATTLSDTFNTIGNTHVPALKITAVTDDGDPNFRRSDHAPFWDIGVDALFLTDGANFRTPHYHRPSDQLDKLDTEFMTQIVKTAVGTLATLAEVTHSGTALSEPLTLQ
ncbi:M28 family metallopeptidase [Marinicella sp. W31]|uniref:M28 family metallopeptidase n=1 Tax=Marinicella sp. W31 TaxID=3023713 RepID=UPI00375712A7